MTRRINHDRLYSTGLFGGGMFCSANDVLEYFTVENMDYMFSRDHDFSQCELDDMARYVIEHGINMEG